MEWIAAAVVFCVVLLKFPRVTLIATGLAVAIGAAFLGYIALQDGLSARAKKKVSVSAGLSELRCTNPQYPLLVSITNNANREVRSTYFVAEGRFPGRSSVVATTGPSTADNILGSNESAAACWSVHAAYGSGFDARDMTALGALEWSVRTSNPSFSN